MPSSSSRQEKKYKLKTRERVGQWRFHPSLFFHPKIDQVILHLGFLQISTRSQKFVKTSSTTLDDKISWVWFHAYVVFVDSQILRCNNSLPSWEILIKDFKLVNKLINLPTCRHNSNHGLLNSLTMNLIAVQEPLREISFEFEERENRKIFSMGCLYVLSWATNRSQGPHGIYYKRGLDLTSVDLSLSSISNYSIVKILITIKVQSKKFSRADIS